MGDDLIDHFRSESGHASKQRAGRLVDIEAARNRRGGVHRTVVHQFWQVGRHRVFVVGECRLNDDAAVLIVPARGAGILDVRRWIWSVGRRWIAAATASSAATATAAAGTAFGD